jgi:hypothetical protein
LFLLKGFGAVILWLLRFVVGQVGFVPLILVRFWIVWEMFVCASITGILRVCFLNVSVVLVVLLLLFCLLLSLLSGVLVDGLE